MKQEVILMRGLPGSGKSTLARQMLDAQPNAYKRLNKDELRAMLDNGQYSPENEKFVERVRDAMLLEALHAGKSVIIDDTNLADRPVTRIRQLVEQYARQHHTHIELRIIDINTPLEECIARDAQREKPVGSAVITRMYQQHIAKKGRGPYYREQNEALRAAVLCDLDGTLAILNGRSPYDGTACLSDLPNRPIVELVRQCKANGDQIILLSGREAVAEPQTRQWLAQHGVPYDALYMRTTNDSRKDAIVKRELFEQHIENRYYIRFVLDDRNQVVDLWRIELGLPCLQVNYGDF